MKRVLLLVAALLMAAGGAYAELIGSHEGGEFDGSTVAVDTEIEVGMAPGDEYSVSGWITTESGEGWIFGVANCGEDGVYGSNSNGLYMAGGGFDYDMWWVGATGTGDQGLNDGEQHHVAYTLDADGNVVLYVDGAEVGDGSGFGWPEHEPEGVYTTVTLGFSGEADGSPGDDPCDVGVGDDGWPGAFTGLIEDVQVYDHALDAGEVSDLFDAGPGGAGAAGGCGAALTDTGEDTEGYDICLTGTIAAGEEVTVVMFSPDGEVDPDWWELGTRTDQGWVGDYTYIGDSPTFELTQAMLDGSLEFINGEPEVFVHYNGDDLCECEGGEPAPSGGPTATISGNHRPLVGQDVTLEVILDGVDDPDPTYSWSKDGGGEIGTGDTLELLTVTEDDTGDYSVVVTYDDGGGDAAYAELEATTYVWVTAAGLPLAGGLGLGLLAGACALAGAVSIRRKK